MSLSNWKLSDRDPETYEVSFVPLYDTDPVAWNGIVREDAGSVQYGDALESHNGNIEAAAAEIAHWLAEGWELYNDGEFVEIPAEAREIYRADLQKVLEEVMSN